MATTPPSRVFQRSLNAVHPLVERGEGAYVWDSDGNRYLDASSGLNVVVGIGYGVQEVVDAMAKQASAVAFCAGFTSRAQEELATAIADHTPDPLNYVRFTSGGSESTETAIKLARHYFLEVGKPSKWKIIGRWKSYHGNTLGALSASGHTGRRSRYVPLLANFAHIPPAYSLEDAEALESTILNEGPDQVAAFIAEPVVGAADFGRMAPAGYYERIREICDKYDVLFIADEIMSGFGRTGKFFAVEHWDAVPDIIAFAKGASSGYTPLGGIVASSKIYEAIKNGSGQFDHGHTYTGNPLSCAVGLAVLKYIDDHDLVRNSAEVGAYLLDRLRDVLLQKPLVGEISGAGMMIGIELVADKDVRSPFPPEINAPQMVGDAVRKRGVLINLGFGSSLPTDPPRIGVCPPLIFTKEQVDETVDALAHAIDEVSASIQHQLNVNKNPLHESGESQ